MVPNEEYRGWHIAMAYIGWEATHPDYDASYEGPEDGWVGNGLHLHAHTLVAIREEVDNWIEEHADDE